MSFETITNIYPMEDVGSVTNYIKVMSSLSVAKESQRTLCGVVLAVVADPDPAAVQKSQSDFPAGTGIVIESRTRTSYVLTMAHVCAALTGPITLNTSKAPWAAPIGTLIDLVATPRLGEQAANTMTRTEPAAVSAAEWKGSARKLAESMGLVHAVHQYASLARASFNVIGPVNVQSSNDPETDDRYLAIDFRVSGSVDEALASEERFQTAAVREMAMDKLFYLRLSYDLI